MTVKKFAHFACHEFVSALDPTLCVPQRINAEIEKLSDRNAQLLSSAVLSSYIPAAFVPAVCLSARGPHRADQGRHHIGDRLSWRERLVDLLERTYRTRSSGCCSKQAAAYQQT